MKKSTKYAIIGVCVAATFIFSITQLAIGFRYLVKDGEDPNTKCRAAPDLPILLAIGGVFSLCFLGATYGCLKTISSITKIQSNIPGKTPKILTGLFSFIFGALTLVFFIFIQIRVYSAYGNHVQSIDASRENYCRSGLIQGALAVVILTYVNIILLAIIVLIICGDLRKKIQEKKEFELEMDPTVRIDRV